MKTRGDEQRPAEISLAILGGKGYNDKYRESGIQPIKEVRCVVSGDPFGRSWTLQTRRTR
jgi:hypothetical protein